MNPSFVAGLVIGCFVGAIVYAFFQKFMDNQAHDDWEQEQRNEWNWLFDNYPVFMNQIKEDVLAPAHAEIREFFVVDKAAIMNSVIPRFRYDLSEELLPALHKLEELGYIEQLPNDALLYQIDESLVIQLKSTTAINLFGAAAELPAEQAPHLKLGEGSPRLGPVLNTGDSAA